MAQKPINMEEVKQVLQLYRDGIGIREICRRTAVSRNTVRKYLRMVEKEAGDTSGSVNIISDKDLAAVVYNNDSLTHDELRYSQLIEHLGYAHIELNKTGVTRLRLWEEYVGEHPDGYGYSQYCYHFQQYLKQRDLSMHLEYRPADMLMIDFTGKKLFYQDVLGGCQVECEVFVAILPFSGYIFCYAVHSQQTADFADCINAMLKFYSGVPATIICDNLKTAVIRADRYEPVFTDICLQLSEHYATTFSATRPYSPRDKAMVERAVNIVYTRIFASLRNQHFNSLTALNRAINEQLTLLNNKPYRHTPYSRRYFFEEQEKSLLKALPSEPFCKKKVVILTVQRNYHVQLSEDRHYYSVPYQHVGKKVKVLYDNKRVEIYMDLQRIALHPRSTTQLYATLSEHMPPHHAHMQRIKGFSREDLLKMAQLVGDATCRAATLILQNNIYMEQNYKSCFGMLMLEKKYGKQRLEAACSRALTGSRVNYTMIRNILQRGLDGQTAINDTSIIVEHDNIRGKEYYE